MWICNYEGGGDRRPTGGQTLNPAPRSMLGRRRRLVRNREIHANRRLRYQTNRLSQSLGTWSFTYSRITNVPAVRVYNNKNSLKTVNWYFAVDSERRWQRDVTLQIYPLKSSKLLRYVCVRQIVITTLLYSFVVEFNYVPGIKRNAFVWYKTNKMNKYNFDRKITNFVNNNNYNKSIVLKY